MASRAARFVKRTAAGLLLTVLGGICAASAQLPAWQATHPQHPGTLLLLGSIHLLRADDHPLPAIVDDVYQRAGRLVFELDLDDIAAAQMQSRFMGAAMLAADTMLQDVIEPQLFEATRQQAETYGVDIRLFSRFEPWFVATMLMSFGLTELGYEPRFGIEQYLLARARSDAKEVNGIEALETQIAVFDLLTDQDQSAFLEQTLIELQRDDETMSALVEAWRNGALGELHDDLMGDFEQFPELYERLVAERNTAWADALESYAARDEVSAVVVGALHLVGDDSVIELLRARGYTVTPMH